LVPAEVAPEVAELDLDRAGRRERGLAAELEAAAEAGDTRAAEQKWPVAVARAPPQVEQGRDREQERARARAALA